MDRIAQAFLNRKRRAVLIPFLNAGDPTFDASVELFRSVLRAGADIIEIGTPYSDPLADGPVIQSSALRSLKSGFELPHSFEVASTLRKEGNHAQVLFTYVNPLFQYTPDRFFRDAAAAGVDGVIIPDLPLEESTSIRETADEYGIAVIPLIAPTSGEQRIQEIASTARGFIYCVSSLGVTGERVKMSNRVRSLVETARKYSDLPVAVGFGVSTPEQARALSEYADGVIVGSAFIRRIHQNLESGRSEVSELGQSVYDFARQLVEGMIPN